MNKRDCNFFVDDIAMRDMQVILCDVLLSPHNDCPIGGLGI